MVRARSDRAQPRRHGRVSTPGLAHRRSASPTVFMLNSPTPRPNPNRRVRKGRKTHRLVVDPGGAPVVPDDLLRGIACEHPRPGHDLREAELQTSIATRHPKRNRKDENACLRLGASRSLHSLPAQPQVHRLQRLGAPRQNAGVAQSSVRARSGCGAPLRPMRNLSHHAQWPYHNSELCGMGEAGFEPVNFGLEGRAKSLVRRLNLSRGVFSVSVKCKLSIRPPSSNLGLDAEKAPFPGPFPIAGPRFVSRYHARIVSDCGFS